MTALYVHMFSWTKGENCFDTMVFYLPANRRTVVLMAFPRTLVAEQTYVPASSRETFCRIKEPFKTVKKRLGVLSFLIQVTSGCGRPEKAQGTKPT